MNYWFVCHGKMGSEQRAGGYLFAPLLNVAGNIEAYWELVDQVWPGDVVFCHVDGQIRSVALVQSEVRRCEGPWIDESGKVAQVAGRRVDVKYQDLEPPLALDGSSVFRCKHRGILETPAVPKEAALPRKPAVFQGKMALALANTSSALHLKTEDPSLFGSSVYRCEPEGFRGFSTGSA